jgi:hypothetical protein
MDLTKNTLWVLGDSFCTEAENPPRWPFILIQYLNKKYNTNARSPFIRYYNYGGGSMDTQTIIENWIKLLPYIKEGDAMVICASDISRARYPFKNPGFYSLPFKPNPNNAPVIEVNFDYAPVGYDPTNSEMDERTDRLDVPFTTKDAFKDYIRTDNVLLSTKAHDKNKIELIEALYKATPCDKKFIYTWADFGILKSDYIYSKDWVSENVMDGKWESLHEEWLRTNGECGIQHDGHLSGACEKMMAEYFIKEFEI